MQTGEDSRIFTHSLFVIRLGDSGGGSSAWRFLLPVPIERWKINHPSVAEFDPFQLPSEQEMVDMLCDNPQPARSLFGRDVLA